MNRTLHIAVVEDHDALREMTVAALRRPGWRVCGFESAEALYEAPEQQAIDIALLDLNLPGEDGLSLARRLRERQPGMGIIMLTVRDRIDQRVAGYEQGADIYLPKPAATEELVATVGALARRLAPRETKLADYELDLEAGLLRGPLRSVKLQESETALLRAFALAPGGRLETWQMQVLLGEDKTSRLAIAIRASRLRKKLNDAGATEEALRAIRGQGYRLFLDLRIAG
ncbi:response regulator transcription factor [uncultured Azonexus sp.]|uniref:response regulator transcription factor n=1 Tax=uncultured Azonexus sp. TaxID=520307 RepID=UPI00262D56EF|nr:response regulator transcription factor [uncultured Azonexus sp.]